MGIDLEAIIDRECPTPMLYDKWRRWLVARIGDEIDQINTDRDTLTRENADLRARLAKMTKTLGDAGDEISNLSMLASNIEQRAERAEKARDEEAEAKRVLGRELFNRCFLGYDKAWRDAEIAKIRNPTAAAAVKEAGQ